MSPDTLCNPQESAWLCSVMHPDIWDAPDLGDLALLSPIQCFIYLYQYLGFRHIMHNFNKLHKICFVSHFYARGKRLWLTLLLKIKRTHCWCCISWGTECPLDQLCYKYLLMREAIFLKYYFLSCLEAGWAGSENPLKLSISVVCWLCLPSTIPKWWGPSGGHVGLFPARSCPVALHLCTSNLSLLCSVHVTSFQWQMLLCFMFTHACKCYFMLTTCWNMLLT